MQVVPRVPLNRPATYEDLVALPEHVVGEILDGELYSSPRPAPPHLRAETRLGSLLLPPFDQGRGGPGGWTILFEPELHVADDVLVPDVAGWRRQRMPRLPTTAYFPMAPDWICEVLSPSTANVDRAKKLPIYAREGVEVVWLVDPLNRTLELLVRSATNWTMLAVYDGSRPVRLQPFDALEFDLELLWAAVEVEGSAPHGAEGTL
jgi:Uma2 family endonuclease